MQGNGRLFAMSHVMKPIDSTHSPQASRQVFQIEGMHCGSCVARLENGLKQQFPQLSDVRVNLATGQAVLDGDIAPKAVIDAVDHLGYKASLMKTSADHQAVPASETASAAHDHGDMS